MGLVMVDVGGKGGHLMESRCQDCHVAEKVNKKNASLLVASQEKLCINCHANALQLSHPSGILPKRTLPSEFPLDWKGSLTCSSCHTVHDHKAGLMRSSLTGADLCLQCHDKSFFEKMADGGGSVTGFGHLDARASQPELSLDAFTLQCMGCHDDQGGDNRVGIGSNGVLNHFGSSVNHPIGGNYTEVTQGGGYYPINRLPSKILLPDGKVGCVSCHEGYSTVHGQLLKILGQSDLCLVCHDL